MTTKMGTKNTKLRWMLPLGAAGAALGVLAALNPRTWAQTTPDADDERLRTRRYHASLDEVMKALDELIPTLRTYGANWRLVQSQRFDESTPYASGTIRVKVPVTVFVDDLTIMLRAAGEATIVDVRSQTQVQGRSDFGENKRHVIQLLSALDEDLEQV